MNKVEIENLLIKSVHSDENAKQFFLNNLENVELFYVLLDIATNSCSGDARMESSYYLAKFNDDIIKKEENKLLCLVKDEWDSVAVHIFIALARVKSKEAIKYIINERIKKEMYWEAKALNIYLDFEENEL